MQWLNKEIDSEASLIRTSTNRTRKIEINQWIKHDIIAERRREKTYEEEERRQDEDFRNSNIGQVYARQGRDIVEAERERLYGKRAVELRKADEPAMELRKSALKRPKLIGDEGTAVVASMELRMTTIDSLQLVSGNFDGTQEGSG